MASYPQRVDLDFGGVARAVGLLDPTSAQDAATKAYVDQTVEGLSWKDSVRAASTANINLSAPGATIDGVSMASNDRFLAKDQSTATQNGIYIWNGAATPATRALDASTFGELEAAVVVVEEGTTNSATTWRQTQVNGVIDTNNIAFSSFGSSAPAATETTAGIAEIATQSETDTGSDDARFITPLKLATWSNRPRRYTTTIGDGSATSITVTHNLGSKDVHVTVYEASGNQRKINCEERHNATNSVDLLFNSAPASNSLSVFISR